MEASAQVVTLWGKRAPAHSITAILITEDQRTIVTGSQEGQICLWNLSSDLKVSSKQILFGHAAPVTCLAKARDFEKLPYVVSASENGEMCVWSATGGQCIESTTLPFRHTAICYYHSSFRMAGDGWLLCCGQYNDVLVVDAKTLAVVHTLTSSCSPDWVSCVCLVHSPRIQEDSLIAVSVTGDLKVWDLSASVSKIQEKQSVHEREAKALGCAACRAVRFCTYTGRLLLVVFAGCWKVYDYCDFSLLWTESSPNGQRLAGGEVLAAHRLIVWTEGGHGYIYQLLNSGLSRSAQPSSDGRVLRETVYPLLLCSSRVEEKKESFSYVMGFMNERKEPFYKVLYSGDASGRVTLWHVPDVPVSTLDGSPKEIPIAASWTLQDSFDAHSSRAAGVLDHLCAGGRSATICSSAYIPSLDKLVCGCEDGRIFVVLALHAVKARLLEDGSSLKSSLPHRILSGHLGSVTSLLYLHSQSARFDPSWLVSGSQDSCVIWWDLFTGEILHHFSLQAGPVMSLLLSSESYRFRSHRIVCCLCGDHSVALLHIQERRCVLHARKHLFPVKTLRWHPVENLLIVGCENDSIYIWDIETGILERHETGEVAQAILACCEDSALLVADSPLSACEDDPHRQQNAGRQPSGSYRLGSSLSHGERSSRRLAPVCRAQRPFTILPVKMKWEATQFHVLLFDLEKLVELLRSSQLKGLKASSSFHSYDILKRAKSTAEKRTLMLKRNRTSGSLSPLDGQVRSEEQIFGESKAGGSWEQSSGIKRQKKPKSSKKARRQPSGRVDMNVATDTARLLLSCLLPWGVDKELDDLSVQHLELLKLLHPISFGLVSRDGQLTLGLPGWSNADPTMAERPQDPVNLFSSKVLDLRSKYVSVAQEQAGKSSWSTKDVGTKESLPTLVCLLSRICLVHRMMSVPLGKASPQKLESVRTRWRAVPSVGTIPCYAESSDYLFQFPVRELETLSLAKLVSCWRSQSIEVTEAVQAALLAELEGSMKNLRKSLANGHGQAVALPASATGQELKTDQPQMTNSHPLSHSVCCVSTNMRGGQPAVSSQLPPRAQQCPRRPRGAPEGPDPNTGLCRICPNPFMVEERLHELHIAVGTDGACTAPSMVKHDSTSLPADFQGGGDSAERRVLEESDNPELAFLRQPILSKANVPSVPMLPSTTSAVSPTISILVPSPAIPTMVSTVALPS